MVIEVYAACRYSSGAEKRDKAEKDALRQGDGSVGGRRVWGMAEEEEKGEREGEEGCELGMGGRHAVALAIHFCLVSIDVESASSHNLHWEGARRSLPKVAGKGVDTFWTIFLDPALEEKVHSFTAHLTTKHENDLDLASRPDESHINDAESLWN